VNAQVASGLLTVYEGDAEIEKYFDYAITALDWLWGIDHETRPVVTESGVRVYFTKPAVYGTHQVVTTILLSLQG